MIDVIVIGGGPAGMMAAVTAAKSEKKVLLLEKMNSLGRKLLITGKGRCNITSSLPMEDFIKNTPGNGKFLYSSFMQFTNKDILEFLGKEGLKTKEERGHRIFPVTDKSQDVLQCFIKQIEKSNIKVENNARVKEILVRDKKTFGVKLENGNTILADKVILATGGKSYPNTGSTGDGYKMVEKLGHTVTKIKPSLVPLIAYEKEMIKKLQGLSLKNVEINITDKSKNKIIYKEMGEMLFTHFGVSGPIILSASAHLVRYPKIQEKLKNKKIELVIDLKPALSYEKLEKRILRDFEELKNKQYKNSLDKLLPQKLIPVIIEKSGITPEKKVNEITKEQRKSLVQLIKQFTIYIKGFRPIEDAIITSGGISVKEINPKTMESKIIQGLYFAGEVIDVDSYTGGFNLQIAYSTGFVAGRSLANN